MWQHSQSRNWQRHRRRPRPLLANGTPTRRGEAYPQRLPDVHRQPRSHHHHPRPLDGFHQKHSVRIHPHTVLPGEERGLIDRRLAQIDLHLPTHVLHHQSVSATLHRDEHSTRRRPLHCGENRSITRLTRVTVTWWGGGHIRVVGGRSGGPIGRVPDTLMEWGTAAPERVGRGGTPRSAVMGRGGPAETPTAPRRGAPAKSTMGRRRPTEAPGWGLAPHTPGAPGRGAPSEGRTAHEGTWGGYPAMGGEPPAQSRTGVPHGSGGGTTHAPPEGLNARSRCDPFPDVDPLAFYRHLALPGLEVDPEGVDVGVIYTAAQFAVRAVDDRYDGAEEAAVTTAGLTSSSSKWTTATSHGHTTTTHCGRL